MSTSPSWFDQDKFSRLVKKVGPKNAAGQPAARQAVPEKKAPSQPLIKEAPLPPAAVEKPKAPPSQPPREARLSQRLPKIELTRPLATEKTVQVPIHADAGLLPKEEPKKEEPKIELKPEPLPEPVVEAKSEPVEKVEPVTPAEPDEDEPVLPAAAKGPSINSQRFMTSQPLSLGKSLSALPTTAKTEPLKSEPIRAPEAAAAPPPKSPPIPEGVVSITSTSGLPRRTAPLPALKSLFQYEIPGGKAAAAEPQAKSPVAEPPAPKSLPAFTFQKPPAKPATQMLPPALDEEADIPSFPGLSDAEDMVEAPEAETASAELSVEKLAADWGKTDELKEDLERITRERDEVRGEYIKLRQDFEKLKQEQLQGKKETPVKEAPVEDQSDLTKELEQARAELAKQKFELQAAKIDATGAENDAQKLREQLSEREKEISVIQASSDEAEKEVKNLQEQLAERDKQVAKTNSVPTVSSIDTDEIEKLRSQIADQESEIEKLKIAAADTEVLIGKLKEETDGVRNEVKKAQNEASVAQRGLALSQKALQETREALREASEARVAGKK